MCIPITRNLMEITFMSECLAKSTQVHVYNYDLKRVLLQLYKTYLKHISSIKSHFPHLESLKILKMKLNIILTSTAIYCNLLKPTTVTSTPLQKSTSFRINRPASYYRTIQKHQLNPRDFLTLPKNFDVNDVGYSRKRRNHFASRPNSKKINSKISKFELQQNYIRKRRDHVKRQFLCRRTCGTVCEKRNPFGKCKLPNLKHTLNFSLCEGVCMLCQNNLVNRLNGKTCFIF